MDAYPNTNTIIQKFPISNRPIHFRISKTSDYISNNTKDITFINQLTRTIGESKKVPKYDASTALVDAFKLVCLEDQMHQYNTL